MFPIKIFALIIAYWHNSTAILLATGNVCCSYAQLFQAMKDGFRCPACSEDKRFRVRLVQQRVDRLFEPCDIGIVPDQFKFPKIPASEFDDIDSTDIAGIYGEVIE